MEMLRHYPQMDVPYYAESQVMPPFHRNIIEQLRPQISGMSQKQAANALLHFVQYAFDYATDDIQHGYEKPYFSSLYLSVYIEFVFSKMQTTPRIGFWLDNSNQTPQQTAETF